MATEFRLPELGENIESGKVTSVMVSVGDTIAQDQPVIEVETDKAALEVPSSVSGTVKEIRVKEGQDVKVGRSSWWLRRAARHQTGSALGGSARTACAGSNAARKAAPLQRPRPGRRRPNRRLWKKEAARERCRDRSRAPEAAEPPKRPDGNWARRRWRRRRAYGGSRGKSGWMSTRCRARARAAGSLRRT